MKTVTSKYWGGLVIVISLLAGLLALPATAAAQSNSGTEEDVKVLAHLPLSGIHVNGMFIQHRNDKDYLYLHRPVRQAFAVVDVSKPEKPVILDKAALQEPARSQVSVNAANSALAIAVAPEDHPRAGETKSNDKGGAGTAVELPTETLRLMDLSNPKHPRVLKTFTGVTSYLPDDSRHLIYIVNQDGLTIIRHRQAQPMPFCTSEDALTQQPNCQ